MQAAKIVCERFEPSGSEAMRALDQKRGADLDDDAPEGGQAGLLEGHGGALSAGGWLRLQAILQGEAEGKSLFRVGGILSVMEAVIGRCKWQVRFDCKSRQLHLHEAQQKGGIYGIKSLI